MSLAKPTPGELVDRISILELKQRAGRTVTGELDELLPLLNVWLETKVDYTAFSEKADRLREINQWLWAAEDRIRANIKEWDEGLVAQDVLEIVKLNDTRCKLVAAIDGLFGLTQIEKVYATV